MSKITISIGFALSVIGVLSYVVTGFESPTSLIPTFMGVPLIACGYLSKIKPEKIKIWAHIAVVLAALGTLAAGSRIPSLEEFGSVKSLSIWSMFVLCFILLGLYIQSFIKARRP